MLNEERVITMTKMAMYDKGNKKQNLKIASYYRTDYVTFQTIMTLLWATVGYAILAGCMLMMELDELLNDLSFEYMIQKGITIVGGYFITIIIVGVIAAAIYTMKYQNALKVVKPYYQALGRLNTEYKRER